MPDIGLYDYAYSADLVRLVVLLGVALSALFYERFQLTTGGAIVPAFLALSLPHPPMVATTLAIALATWFVVHRILPRWFILYGRHRVEVEYLVGLTFVLLAVAVASVAGAGIPALYGYTAIGMLIPGIVAHDMGRQGPLKTMATLGATTALLAAVVVTVDTLLRFLALPAQTLAVQKPDATGFPPALLLVAVTMSVLVSVLLYSTLGLRSGGFVTAGYLALVCTRPLDLAFVLGCAAITYAIVVYGLIPRLLLFGRRKLTTMMLVAGIVAWAGEMLITQLTHNTVVPWLGLAVATLIAPALLANDAQRQGWRKTLWATLLATLAVYGGVNLLAGLLGIVGLSF